MFIDTHCHLNFPEFKTEVSAVIGRARDAKVDRMINVGIDEETSRRSLELARRYPEVYATVGIHPHCSLDLSIETRSSLLKLAAHEKVVAIGEIGLDYYYLKRSSQFAHYPSREEQIFCFEQMLDLALETQLPVIVHSREADADVLAILKSYSGALRGVMHCFSGDYDYAQKVLDLGFYISVTGNITFKKSSDTIEAIRRIPTSSMMIETDAPYLAPEPYRGKRNEPAYVVEVAKRIAEIKGISLAEVEHDTTKKAMKLFGIS
ncbi:MAG: putative deoxyribonuclease YcfH [bacterium ADurb.Bin400]|nr:MAG: putative deoxyribonuclease YcfH [bacterium ADurb.Bin400]